MAAVGLIGGSLLGEKKLIDSWRGNPDPLNGRAPEFPPGTKRVVSASDGAELLVTTAGTGPTIVLVHGLTSNHADMGLLAGLLIDYGFEVVAVDQRGHGGSTVGSEGFSPRRLGADLAQIFDDLDLTEAVLVGHSMGGIAAMSYAVNHVSEFHKRIKSLVIVASIGRIDPVRQRIGARFMPKKISQRQRVGAGLLTFGAKPSLNMVDQGLKSAQGCPFEVRVAAARGLAGYDILDQLDQIAVPTMVIWGKKDRITDPRANRAIVHHIPGAIPVEIADAGHVLIWERAPELAELIIDMARS